MSRDVPRILPVTIVMATCVCPSIFFGALNRSYAFNRCLGGFGHGAGWRNTLPGHVFRTLRCSGGAGPFGAFARALAAFAMDSLAWLTQQTTALRPVWTLMHVAVMVWGLLMMVQSRQPVWVEQAGRSVWRRVQPLVNAPGGVLATGFLWALMPCGLLYSALLVAALSGGPLEGAVTMALFGFGSGAWLVAGPWLWSRLKHRLDAKRAEWGTRAAGGLLFAVAAWALWLDLIYKPSLWCR